MTKKKVNNISGIIFSTNPDFKLNDDQQPEQETPDPALQKLTLRLDTKQRAGKAVTLVDGFAGKDDDLEELGRKLKSFCGSGGSVKNGVIIVQGDQKDKLFQWLLSNGYRNTKVI